MNPGLVYWKTRTPGIILTSLVGNDELEQLAEGRDKDGCKANHVVCRRWRPYGVTHWSWSPDGPWQEIGDNHADSR